jgi:hypothetical protein
MKEISKRKFLIAQPEQDLCTLCVTDPIHADRLDIFSLKSLLGLYRKPSLKEIDLISSFYLKSL